MPISPDMLNRLRITLLKCSPFATQQELKSIFVDGRVSAWRDLLPETNNRLARINMIIDVLSERSNEVGENALVLFLEVLGEHVPQGDTCQSQLAELAFALTKQLDRPVGHTTTSIQSAPAPPLSFTDFENYHIEQELDRGHISTVYKARDLKGRLVVIKVFDITDELLASMFIQKSRRALQLNKHPNICRIYAVDQDQNHRPYLVMEYVKGVCMRQLLTKDLDPQEIAYRIGQICGAVHYAHQKKIVNYCIRPEDILIDSQGRVRMIHMGIPKFYFTSGIEGGQSTCIYSRNGVYCKLANRQELYPLEKVYNTGLFNLANIIDLYLAPEYISPEQVKAKSVAPAPSSNIYSLGIIMYELLTGHPPFPLDPAQPLDKAILSTLSAHLHTIPSFSEEDVTSEIREKTKQVTLKALAKTPEARYQSAWEIAQALEFCGEQPTMPLKSQQNVARLVILNGAQKGKSIELNADVTLLGRRQINPDDIYISRNHFTIEFRNGELWIEDRSSNGTWINNIRVQGQARIQHDDRIRVSETSMRLIEISLPTV